VPPICETADRGWFFGREGWSYPGSNLGSFGSLPILRLAPQSAGQSRSWVTRSMRLPVPVWNDLGHGSAVSVVNAWWRFARSARRIQDVGDPVLTRPLLKLSSCDPPEADVAALIAHGARPPYRARPHRRRGRPGGGSRLDRPRTAAVDVSARAEHCAPPSGK